MARIWITHKVLSVSCPPNWTDEEANEAAEKIEFYIEEARKDLETEIKMAIGGDLRVKVRD